MLAAGTAGGLSGVSRAKEEARHYGASKEDQEIAARWGFIPGVVQVLPVARLFDKFNKASGGIFIKQVQEALRSGGFSAADSLSRPNGRACAQRG